MTTSFEEAGWLPRSKKARAIIAAGGSTSPLSRRKQQLKQQQQQEQQGTTAGGAGEADREQALGWARSSKGRKGEELR